MRSPPAGPSGTRASPARDCRAGASLSLQPPVAVARSGGNRSPSAGSALRAGFRGEARASCPWAPIRCLEAGHPDIAERAIVDGADQGAAAPSADRLEQPGGGSPGACEEWALPGLTRRRRLAQRLESCYFPGGVVMVESVWQGDLPRQIGSSANTGCDRDHRSGVFLQRFRLLFCVPRHSGPACCAQSSWCSVR